MSKDPVQQTVEVPTAEVTAKLHLAESRSNAHIYRYPKLR